MKKALSIIVLLFFYLLASAQKKNNLHGILLDNETQKPISSSTISIYSDIDTILLSYTLSDPKGNFQLTNLEKGKRYRVVISAWLYSTVRRDIVFPQDSTNLEIGKIFLKPKDFQLKEVEIVSERPPIIVRNDTIEYNAASFKTLPTAFVEDLFKKLPGFTLSSNGDILVNGRPVSRILVEGREFFGGDKLIATKQLPANIVDKVIVADDEIVKKRNRDLSQGELPQVINLTLKKDVKKGLFGKIYAGNALEKDYEAGGIINVFRDTLQISALAYSNNINRTGFSLSDVTRIGGFSRSGYSSTVMNENGSFSLDKISFGGGDNGIQKSLGAGLNFNTLTKGNLKINGKYFFGRSDIILEQTTLDDQTIGQDRLMSNSTLSAKSISDTHNIGAKLVWPIDKLTNLYLEPTISISPVDAASSSYKLSENAKGQKINSASTLLNNNGRANQYRFSADFDKGFKNSRRSLTLSLSGRFGESQESLLNTSNTTLMISNIISNIDQLRNNEIQNANVAFSGNYVEPITKSLSISATFSTTYLSTEDALLTFYKNTANSQYDLFVPNFSETANQEGFRIGSRVRLRWSVTKDLSLQPSLGYTKISLDNSFVNYQPIRQRYQFLAPGLSIKYKILTIEYLPSFVEPDVRYIQPILNNTDPLFIQEGNAALEPTRTYPIFVRVYKYNPKTFLNYNLFANANIKKGSLIMSRTTTSNGIQTNKPISVDNAWEVSSGGGVGKDIKAKKVQMNLNFTFNIKYNRDFVDVNTVRSQVNNFSLAPIFGMRLNFSDVFETNTSYSVVVNNASYEETYFSNQRFLTQRLSNQLTIRYPKKLVFDSQFNLLINDRNISGFKNDLISWNLGLTYLFMKNDRAQLRFSINDILQSNVKRNLSILENRITDTQSNSLGRFSMITLSYNIQNFGGNIKKSTILGAN